MTANNPSQPDPAAAPPDTPLGLLAAQAEEVARVTGGRLVGVLTTGQTPGGDLEHTLSVRAPWRTGDGVRLVQVTHAPDQRFIRMETDLPRGTLELRGLNELRTALQRVLLSVEVTQALALLLARTMD